LLADAMVEANKESPTFSPLLASILHPDNRPLLLTTNMNLMVLEIFRLPLPVGVSFLPIDFKSVKHLIDV